MVISSIYSKSFQIPASAIDENGHVNNVAYVQWMQEVAIEHYLSNGGTHPRHLLGGTWVVREHKIEYLLPAFVGEEIEIRTWVENIRRVRLLRQYEFIRRSEYKVLARGETVWVYVDASTGSPLAIPKEVYEVFSIHE